MRHHALAVVALLVACGGPPTRFSDDRWRPGAQEREVVVGFLPGSAALQPADAARIASLRDEIAPGGVVDLASGDALSRPRAAAIEALLGRGVGIETPAEPASLAPDTGIVLIREPAIVATACQRPGVAVGRNIWPGDDADRQRLMPSACAVDLALQAQVADQQDLLRGRPLPPGAAGPFVSAVERYYDRNEPKPEVQRVPEVTSDVLSTLSRFPQGVPQAAPPSDQAAPQPPAQLQDH